MIKNIIGRKIAIKGIVQGVGFRPFVYGLAKKYALFGWVRNTSKGVDIEVNGAPKPVDQFITELQLNPPPLARIDLVDIKPCQPNGYIDFKILTSQPLPEEFILISPDVSICTDCQRELLDPANKRFRYPFINCTNCGPRFTIIKEIPYDRPLTTMASFNMCNFCKSEYDNPNNRRFHAQPVACQDCGPHVWLQIGDNFLSEKEGAIQTARDLLKKGKILAVKGLGGFHLACDATNQTAVEELRKRKIRSEKPFAVMVYDICVAEKHCLLNKEEIRLLESREKPIVLCRKKLNSSIVPQITPNLKHLGIMLPYTPLHLLLLEPSSDFPEAIVMTSGNIREEPIAFTNNQAQEKLSSLSDAFLMHNRDIHIRVDDSVVYEHKGNHYFIRRARGYAPNPIQLPNPLPEILAVGASMKNTFCLTRRKYAFLSHHIGELENLETLESFQDSIAHYEELFRIKPRLIACDLHPDYLSTRYAQDRSISDDIPLIQIQHHHAHLASCLADNNWASDEPVIGICFDGTGLGTDSTIWGGEFLFGSYREFQRLYHLSYVPLPGGDAATKNPCRMALAELWANDIPWQDNLAPFQALSDEQRAILLAQLEGSINSPQTSSMGRLFDTVAALIGIRQQVNYEAQAAIELEAIIDPDETDHYLFDVDGNIISLKGILESLISDIRKCVAKPILAAKFHNAITNMVREVCMKIKDETGCSTVALSGGVWQNLFLLEKTENILKKNGFTVLFHQNVPSNDGGISLGQALIAATKIRDPKIKKSERM